jgi:DNA polymerase III delta' subunit
MKLMHLLLTDQTKLQIDAVTPTGSGSYLFHGVKSVGKASAALQLARRLNCLGDQNGLCAHCHLFEAGNFPDLITVAPEDKPSITIEQVRGLIQGLGLRPYYAGGIRLILIDGAEVMTAEAQNALLKVIEEPPQRTMFVLVAERPDALLSTVRSRCRHVYFPSWPAAAIARHLVDTHGLPSATAAGLAEAADGAPGRAIQLAAQPELAAAQLELAKQAGRVPGLSRFERLLLAARLAGSGADLNRFAGYLHRAFTAGLRDGTVPVAAAHRGLAALEQFRRQVQAKVSPRVAMERLMVEL